MAEHLDETKDLLVAAARLRYAPETAQKTVLLHHRLQGVEPKSAVAAASLFLAGKADEQPRRVRDVLNAVAPAGGVKDLDEAYPDAKADLVDAEQAARRELSRRGRGRRRRARGRERPGRRGRVDGLGAALRRRGRGRGGGARRDPRRRRGGRGAEAKGGRIVVGFALCNCVHVRTLT